MFVGKQLCQASGFAVDPQELSRLFVKSRGIGAFSSRGLVYQEFRQVAAVPCYWAVAVICVHFFYCLALFDCLI